MIRQQFDQILTELEINRLANDETRQVPLFQPTEVAVTVTYISANGASPLASRQGIERTHPQTEIRFTNGPGAGKADQDQAPGVPLPSGTARVYQADSTGSPRLIGEDRIPHTPVGETVKLQTGRAFDITIERRQTAFSRLDADQKLFESAYAITVKNAKTREAKVRIVESLPGDWEILSENTPHQKPTANRAVWPLTVPAGGEVNLTYTVRVRL
ncbi:MAG: hypothetical protein HC826_01790 [Rhodospirillales bacterium]|nr:hypothetical protein [Rhodospirillales bacterium]